MGSKGVNFMDDHTIKNVPADGFSTETGFTERVSNPSSSRRSVEIIQSTPQQMYPQDYPRDSRLSNPTPTRRKRGNNGTVSSASVSIVDDAHSRLSNPTQTRRKHGNNGTVSSVSVSTVDDTRLRLSNPTQTRRSQQSQNKTSDFSSFGVIPNSEMSRASNPTPRRRKTAEESSLTDSVSEQQFFYQAPINSESENEISSDSEQKQSDFLSTPIISESTPEKKDNIPLVTPIFEKKSEENVSLSFASVDNPYGIEESESNVSQPVKVPFEAETSQNSSNVGRLSQLQQTRRRKQE